MSGRTNRILFNEDVVRPQCYGCNINQHGRLDDFGVKLIKEIGSKYHEILKDKYTPLKYTEQELKDMEQEYKQKALELAESKGIVI
jgi:hypothetical protein